MTPEANAKLAPFIAAAGVVASVTAYAVSGAWATWSAAVGALLAYGNFHAWRWLVGRIVARRLASKPALALLLVVKAMLGLGGVALLLLVGAVEPLPFLAGLGALVLGALVGSAVLIVTAPAEAEA